MPSNYELRQEECLEIARALKLWVKVRKREDSALSDWDVLQIIARLGRDGEIDVNGR